MFRQQRAGPTPPPIWHNRVVGARPIPEKPKGKPWIGVFKVLAVVVGTVIGVTVFRLPAFAISEIEVVGLRHRSEADILERASLQGQNLLALPVADLEAALAQDPWVRRVDIQRQLPSRVTLYVQEREPSIVWTAGKREFLADRDGTILEETRRAPQLPLIRDLDGPVPNPGDRKDTDTIALALTLTEILPQEIGQRAKFFEHLSYGGLVVETDKGKRARFGDSSDLQWKLAVWKALLEKAEAEKLKAGHVDLRFGDRPFFRP